jgi:hypothetical protein
MNWKLRPLFVVGMLLVLGKLFSGVEQTAGSRC